MTVMVPRVLPVILLSLAVEGDAFRNAARGSENEPAACQDGDIEEPGCKSVCRWLGLTSSTKNGHCEDWVEKLQTVGKGADAANRKAGTYKAGAWYKFWGHTSSMEPLIRVLSTNCQKQELDFYSAALYQLIENLKEDKPEKYAKYEDELKILQGKLTDVVNEKIAELADQSDGFADDNIPLPSCPADFQVQAGDFLTMEWGGPDFSEISTSLNEYAMHDEALRLQVHYSYGPYFDYSETFNTSSDVQFQNRTTKSKAFFSFQSFHSCDWFLEL
ncbi:unnamed protein product [Symbiodinium natans]|uniref:Uncharacterized protein n=1 Tax=Symbiodinium natans TaxID=878477 RepID=A0A812RJA6_9DINO|nr:unnamed protein product [Symbiodinium natans]